jgi:hypothetical protein
MEAPHPSHSYELAEKSLHEQFEGNMTIICSHNLTRVAHKVSDHHLTGRFLVTCSITSTFFISVSKLKERRQVTPLSLANQLHETTWVQDVPESLTAQVLAFEFDDQAL